MTVEVTLFTDPACPFAFSAEPVRQRLRWHYGDQLRWVPRLIVLTREAGHAERLAEGAPGLQKAHGMPIDPAPYPRPASSEPASRLVVAARLHAPDAVEPLLRRLRVLVMCGGLLDDPVLLATAARESGLDAEQLEAWAAGPAVGAELEADVSAARAPVPAARALDHKLGGPDGERRYSAPSYELRRDDDPEHVVAIPGFNPVEAYETALANLAPGLTRRPEPDGVADVLAWADAPLATAEIALIAQLSHRAAAKDLAALPGVERIPAGADAYWSRAGSA